MSTDRRRDPTALTDFDATDEPADGGDAAASLVRVKSLGSGSSGNAFLVQHGERTLMLDCGVGIRTMTRELAALGSNLASLDAMLITHEHIDHIRTLPRLLGHDVPVIATAGTAGMAGVPASMREEIVTGRPVRVADFTIWSLGVRHDAVEPCGYLIEMDGARITILTDLGCWEQHLADPVAASDLVVLEANHDEEMLRWGPYPMHLKRRVASEVGHLSNRASGEALAGLARVSNATPTIWLAHLSETNNRPDLAERTVRDALEAAGLELDVLALPRRTPGPLWMPAGRRRFTTRFSPTIPQPPVSQLSLLDGFD